MRPSLANSTSVACGALVWIAALACSPAYVETGDLSALRERGVLRVLVPQRTEASLLTRRGHPLDDERELALEFAHSLGIEADWITVNRFEDLIPALLEGRGDLIAANLTRTPQRAEQVAFSKPVSWVREQIITRADDIQLKSPADLAGRNVHVRRSSSFWTTIEAFGSPHLSVQLVPTPENMDTEETLYRVSTGEFDLAAADSNIASEVLAYQPELRVAFDLTKPRPVAWAVRPEASELQQALDRFMESKHLERRHTETYRADLPGIRERGVLRVLTRNSPATYFVWRGELMGFEYELARRFARQLGVRLEMVVAPTEAALSNWLRDGRGDLVAASVTAVEGPTAEGVAFSRPYHWVEQLVVTRSNDLGLHQTEDLAGRTVFVRRSSPQWSALETLRQNGSRFALVAAPEDLGDQGIVDRVAAGKYDVSVIDSHALKLELTWRNDVRAAFPLGERRAQGWVVRQQDRKLLAAVNEFMRREYRSEFYNVIYRRYFEDPKRIRGHVDERTAASGQISPYDDLVRLYAKQYELDWRLIAAQMYQESRFDPNARSFAGAQGLLQVMPATAKEQGFESIEEVDDALHAGIKYLKLLYDRFENEVEESERIWFALAAYNAGRGRVIDARRLARKLGRDSRRWFGHVEDVMPLLSREEYFEHTRYGYCRCTEPVAYVRGVRDRYQAYQNLSDALQL